MAVAVEPHHEQFQPDKKDEDMNDGIDGGRPRTRRAGRHRAGRQAGAWAVTLAAVALLAAACGGGSPGGSTARLTAYQRELAYAECMRAHGMPSWPDPQSNGAFAGSFDFGSRQYRSANRACAHLEGGSPETAQQFQRDVGQSLKFAACMRAHGIANFQATVTGQGEISTGSEGPGGELGSPQFHSANKACRKLQPGGGS
jgi:hypothetical protein